MASARDVLKNIFVMFPHWHRKCLLRLPHLINAETKKPNGNKSHSTSSLTVIATLNYGWSGSTTHHCVYRLEINNLSQNTQ